MTIQEITSVEQWFEYQATTLKLLAPIPDLAWVKDVLERNANTVRVVSGIEMIGG